MKNHRNSFLGLFILCIALGSCNKRETATQILQKTIQAIDNIETIYYKQDMLRSDPRNTNDTIFRYREMYFKRLITDSIVGVKGHWYMYVDNVEEAVYEDIYDGNRLIRKNNTLQAARVYDLIKYPALKERHFWSHNTPYGMQHEFRYILKHTDAYSIERLNDSIVDGRDCYQIHLKLENKNSMPGFAIALENEEGSVANTYYFIDMITHYPIRMHTESYSLENPEQKIFMDQRYYDIVFNLPIDEQIQMNTSDETLRGFETVEIK